MKSMRRSVKGFTFIELIVVMAIIAVLSTTLVIAIGAFVRDNKYNDANAKAETICRALQIKLNQYDAEAHKTISYVDGTSEVEGIGTIPRANTPTYYYIGNFGDTTANASTIGIADVMDTSQTTLASAQADWNMGAAINTVCNSQKLNNNNPSWLAKVDMSTYTVCYVLYTEDNMDLTNGANGFMDRIGSDNTGYYVSYDEQQATAERLNRDSNVIGCYPVQSLLN